MSIQPLFSGPLFLPSQQLINASQPPDADVPSDVDIDNGPTTGNVLDGEGSDFLDPDKIQDIADELTGSIKPVTSDTLRSQLISTMPLPENPDATDILNSTLKGLDIVFDPNIGQGILPRANSNPLTWRNPTPLDIFVGVSAISGDLIFNPNPLPNFIPLNPATNNPLLPNPAFPFPFPIGSLPVGSTPGTTFPTVPTFPNPSPSFPNPSFPGPNPNPPGALPPELINTYMSLLASSSQLMSMMAQTLGLSAPSISFTGPSISI
ncbi:MAG: hypothetical protein VKJ04_07920 [Vampirovibrionales bacterium]|nr:hypothetical protein [Vampirovibrionales bacterium]